MNAALPALSFAGVRLDAHGSDSVRIRVAPPGQPVQLGLVGALTERCRSRLCIRNADRNQSIITNGNIRAQVTEQGIQVSRISDGAMLIEGYLPMFDDAQCGRGFQSFKLNLTAPGNDDIFGLGQLEAINQSDCHDNATARCAPPLNRRQMLAPIPIRQTKYHIALPFLYSSRGFGLLLNHPGDGVVRLPSGRIDVAFSCQRQLDLWISAPGEVHPAPLVYQRYAEATGLPRRLPSWAASYWQSKCAYHNSAEILALAANFSARRLDVGAIVIDLGEPAGAPYYRMDPARFPDLPSLTARVRDLLPEVRLVPNLKPTSVATADCAACGSGHGSDGRADDGALDVSSADCRGCVWRKRVGPSLFAQGLTSYWLDDDETDRFNVSHPACGPWAYCGSWAAGVAWPQLFADGLVAEREQPMLLSRSLWVGAPRLGGALWSSDIVSSWRQLRAQVSVGMAAALSGIPYWTSDVGGFFGVPSEELAARWHQFGSVCPLYRAHGARPYNEPWSFGHAAEVAITKSIALRRSLRQYVLELSENASRTGEPMMRPLWWDFPTIERPMRDREDVFMLGPSLLAAPVLHEGQRTRTVFLPMVEGAWVHYYTRERFAGGVHVTVAAPLDELPLFELTGPVEVDVEDVGGVNGGGVNGGGPVEVDVEDFGAVADNVTLSSPAINRAIRHVSEAGGGVVHARRGSYLCGRVELRSNTELRIAPQSRLQGSGDASHWLPREPIRWPAG